MNMIQGKDSNQAQARGPSSDAPKRNNLYALKYRGDQEGSSNFLTFIFQVFSINVYALLEIGAILLFQTLLVAMKFYMLPDVLVEPFQFVLSD